MGETGFSIKNVPPRNKKLTPVFIKTLKSIVQVEKNPHFRSETLKVESLELKHPKNVIFVVPPFSNAPPRKGITIFFLNFFFNKTHSPPNCKLSTNYKYLGTCYIVIILYFYYFTLSLKKGYATLLH